MSKGYYEIWDLKKNCFTYNEEIQSIDMPNPNMVCCHNAHGHVITLWPVSQIYRIDSVEIPEKGVEPYETK